MLIIAQSFIANNLHTAPAYLGGVFFVILYEIYDVTLDATHTDGGYRPPLHLYQFSKL